MNQNYDPDGCKGYYDEPVGDSGRSTARVAIYGGGVIKVTGVPPTVARTKLDTLETFKSMSHYGPADGDPDLAFLCDMAEMADCRVVAKQLPGSRDADGREILY